MTLSFNWLGHSTFLLDVDGHQVLIDPFMSNNPLCPLSRDDVNPEVILITHAHGDHVGDTSDGPAADTIAIAERTGATIVCNFEIGNWFTAKGISNLWQGNPGGTYRGDFMDVKLTKAFHSSSFGDGSYGGQPNGMIIHAAGKTLYHAGDTSLFGDMALFADEGIDIAFLPIGDHFTMGVNDSIKATKLLRPRHVFPIHYNTFDAIAQNAKAWADKVNRETDAQPLVMDPGQSYTLE